MTLIRRVLAVVALALALPAPVHAFKCMAPLQKDPIVLIDGVPATTGLKQIESEDVFYVSVVCWSPADSTLGAGPGYGVIFVVTKPSIDRATSLLEDISRAQADFYAATGRFGASITELGLAMSGLGVETTQGPDGWRAVVWTELPIMRCEAWGTAEKPAQTHAEGGDPTCAADYESTARFVIPEHVLKAHSTTCEAIEAGHSLPAVRVRAAQAACVGGIRP